MQQVHRSGPLKQQNKAHKNTHRSNRQLKNLAGGRVGSGDGIKHSKQHNKLVESRCARRDRSLMLRKNKREQTLNRKRSIGQLDNAPILVTLLYFSDNWSEERVQKLLQLLAQSEEEGVVKQCDLGKLGQFFKVNEIFDHSFFGNF